MIEDKLTKQMLGKFIGNKLNIQTVLDHNLIAAAVTDDFEKIVKRNMITALSEQIIEKGGYLNYDRFTDPIYSGYVYRYSTYCFSKEQLVKLIDEVFDAGMEAAKDESTTKNVR